MRLSLAEHPYKIADESIVVSLTLPIQPLAKSRARWSSKSQTFYTPKDTATYEQQLAAALRANRKGPPDTADTCYAVRCRFNRRGRGRVDCDNMFKAVADAATKAGIWGDDVQVTEIYAQTFPDCPESSLEVVIHRIESTAPRYYCEGCGADMTRQVYPCQAKRAGGRRRFCSTECRKKNYAATHVDVPCRGCNKTFSRARSIKNGRSFCTVKCSERYHAAFVASSPKSRQGTCSLCGKITARPEYTRCLTCYRSQQTPSTYKEATP